MAAAARVGDVGEGDLGRLPGVGAQIEFDLLPAAGGPGEAVPVAGGPGRGAAVVGEREVVLQPGVPGHVEPGRALGRHGGAGRPAGLGQGRPVVGAGGVRLDEDVVVARLGVPQQLGAQGGPLGGGDTGEVHGAGEALVAVVGVHGGRHGGAGVRPVRVGRPGELPGAGARELRVLGSGQFVGGDAVGAGPVQRVAGRVAERAAEAVQPAGSGERGGSGGGGAAVGAQVVLAEVVGRCASAEVDAAARPLARLDQPAALVEEGPQLELGGDARRRGAGVVHDGAEVAQHAERVRGALFGHVPDRRAAAAGLERVDVRACLRGLRALLGDDEDVRAGPLGHGVGEVLAGDVPAPAGLSGEPHLDLVARPAVSHRGPVLVEVEVVLPAVPLAAPPAPEVHAVRAAAVDAVLELLVAHGLAGDDGDLLAPAARVGRGEPVRGEVGGLQADRGGRPVGVGRGLGDGERERDVLGELLLDQLLVVGEVEARPAVAGVPLVVRVGVGRGLAGRHLGGEHRHAVDVGRVAVRLAVGGVELGGELRVVARDRRVAGGAGEGPVEDVVGGRRGHLPADSVEEEFGGRVVVDAVGEADALLEGVDGPGLRFGAGARAAVGLAGGVGGRALVVVAPLVGEVAVEVDAVAGGDGAVAVDVPQVLAPQTVVVVGEGVVVAVGVGGEDEPQFRGVDDLLDPLVRRVRVQVVVHQPPGHLRGDPLPCVLVGHVEDGRFRPVPRVPGLPRELQGKDVLALDRLSDGDDLGEVRVLPRGAQDLLPQAALSAVRAEHAVGGVLDAVGRAGGQSVLGEVDALFLQFLGLSVGQIDLDGGGAPVGHPFAEFVPVLPRRQEQGHLLLGDVGAEDLDFLGVGGRGVSGLCLGDGCEARSADQERADSEDRSRSVSHEPPREWSATAANRCQAHDTT